MLTEYHFNSLDLLHAAIFDAKPVLTSSDMPPSTPFADHELSDAQIFARLTPLLAAEQEEFHLTKSPYSDKLQQLPELLSSAVQIMDAAIVADVASTDNSPGSEIVEQFQAGIERFGQHGSEELPEARDAHHLARACHLNFVIFYSLVVHRIPHRHRSNQKYADALYSAVRHVKESTWQNISYLRLWM